MDKCEWIDSNIDLPKPGVEVLVEGFDSYNDYYVASATYDPDKGWKSHSDLGDVIAWAYIPSNIP